MKVLKWILGVLATLFLIVFVTGYIRVKDRYPGYEVDINIQDAQPAALKVGFSAVSISPDIPDFWVDANGDSRFFEEDGDTWKDGNGNGQFDPVWMAGFSN